MPSISSAPPATAKSVNAAIMEANKKTEAVSQQAKPVQKTQETNVQANVPAHAPATLAKEGSVGTRVNIYA